MTVCREGISSGRNQQRTKDGRMHDNLQAIFDLCIALMAIDIVGDLSKRNVIDL